MAERDFYQIAADDPLASPVRPGSSLWDDEDAPPDTPTGFTPASPSQRPWRKFTDNAIAVVSVLTAAFVVWSFVTAKSFSFLGYAPLAVPGLVLLAYSALFRFRTAQRVSMVMLSMQIIIAQVVMFVFGLDKNPDAMFEIFLYLLLMTAAISVSVALIYWAKKFEPTGH